MNVSVAMASYNGEKYIKEQIESICSQLAPNDELIISDDGSTDSTRAIIKYLSEKYGFIKLIDGPQMGIVANFSNAIMNCNNEIIFLSDQDDIWCEGKVDCIKKIFRDNPHKSLVLHSALLLEGEREYSQLIKSYSQGVIRNIIKSSYWGCCMAFRKDFIQKHLPLDSCIVAHDQIIGLLSEKSDLTIYLNVPLIKHRIHFDNKTNSLSLFKKICFRISMIKGLYYVTRKK